MELLYLWVDWYNNIKEQGFQFSNKFDIDFDKESKTLSINKSKESNYNLFNDAFINVTGIIGKNGSGKTSLFNVFKEIFTYNLLSFSSYLLVAYTNDNKLYIINKITKEDELKIIKNVKLEGIIKRNKSDEFINQVNLIFHSNSLSIYKENTYGSRYIDISTEANLYGASVRSNEELLKTYDFYKGLIDKETNIEETKEENLNDTRRSLARRIVPERLMFQFDLENKIHFVSNYKKNDWDFVPRYLDAYINPSFFFDNRDEFEKSIISNKLNDIEFLLFEKYSDLKSKIEKKEQFINRILLMFLLYMVLHPDYLQEEKEIFDSYLTRISELDNIYKISEVVKEYIQRQSEKRRYSPHKDLIDFATNIENEFDNYKFCDFIYNTCNRFAINDKLKATLNKLFKFWYDKNFIFSFDWPGLSAGQSALLTLFSRLSFVADRFDPKKTFWILIDEGELYLHPEWQRSFFSDIHHFIPKFFKGKNIQLLLTSHSPFIVSDLPKDNIILLDRNENGLCKVVDKNQFESTFAANIHTLYSSPFYMNSTIGEFAKKKIEEIIDIINMKDFDKKEYAKAIIDLIADDLIRNRLNDMYSESFIQETEKNDVEYLEWLKQEIDRIEVKNKIKGFLNDKN